MSYTTYSGEEAPAVYGDIPTFMALPLATKENLKGQDMAVIGIPFDGVPTYRGGKTALATQEIRKYSLLYGGYNLDYDTDVLKMVKVVDAGDVDIIEGNAAESYRNAQSRVDELVKNGVVPLTIGGDHGINIPVIRAIAENNPAPFGVIIFDTHLDLRDERNHDRLTRSSPCRRLVELPNIDPKNVVIIGARGPRNTVEQMATAKRLGINIFTMRDVDEQGIEKIVEKALGLATVNGRAPYISVDIDSLDCAYAPGTNSPETCGLTSRELFKAIQIATKNGFLGFDLVEVAPEFDSASGTTSIIASRIIAEAIACMAMAKSKK